MTAKKRERIVIISILLLQTLLYLLCGAFKRYIHMDEAYSLGLASYDKVEIQYNDDFYNTWHKGEYYEDYLSLQEDEFGEYSQVYENQKNDVHPPLYYLILRFAMGFAPGGYTIWPGVIVNIIIYAFVTLLSYAVFQRILKGENNVKEKSAAFAFLGSVTMASLTNVLNIRMYALSALNVLLIAYLHIKLRECAGNKARWLGFIGLAAVAGSLTHYYYLFYLFALFVYQSCCFVKSRNYKTLWLYIITLSLAAVASLAIFPYSIQHMFFGYQGEGFMSRLLDVKQFAINICSYIWIINEFDFNYSLSAFAVVAIILLVYRNKYRKDAKPLKETDEDKIFTLNSLLIPTAFYFILVSVASPWMELRYVEAICINIFALVLYYFYRLLKSVFNSKQAQQIVCVMLALMFVVLPITSRQEPQSMYFKSRGDIVARIEANPEIPAVYSFTSDYNRFLDDILLFSMFEQSYIAKDVEDKIENYEEILKDVDLSKGLYVFVNGGEEYDVAVAGYAKAGGFKLYRKIKSLNACSVYYLE